MRHLLQHKQRFSTKEAGFTLVELLVIAPIAILMIGGFIGLLVVMVGDVMITRDENQMLYDAQNALSTIEQDTRLSIQFLSGTTGTLSPQGTNNNFNGTGEFNNSSNTLILRTLATDKNPQDQSRGLVYYKNQPNPCDNTKTSNQLFALTVVYFIKDGSLWRRTILPLNNTSATTDINTVCNAPWQLNSCSPGYTATRCQTNDAELMRGITSLSVKYFSSPSSTNDLGASGAPIASTINVTINGTKDVAGRTIGTTQTVIASKINETPQNVGPTPLAIDTQPLDQKVLYSAKNTTFTSAANYNTAALQWQQSTNNGSTWTNISGATSKTLTLSTVNLGMNNYRYRMRAIDAGMTVYSEAATLNVSTWLPLELQNDWVPYSLTTSGYVQPEYTQTPSGVVLVRGLIKGGVDTSDTTIATLPQGLRPAGRVIFPTLTNSSSFARLDVRANGEMRILGANTGWISINITFIPTGTNHTWTPGAMQAGWEDYAAGYELTRSTVDVTGRAFVQGMIKNGNSTLGTDMVSLPAALKPAKVLHQVAGSSLYYPFWIDTDGNVEKRESSTASWRAINANYFPATYTNWTDLPLNTGSGWGTYSSTYPDAQYTKTSDNIVTLQGLIKTSTAVTANTTIGTLPAGYRPASRMIFIVPTNTGYGRVDVMNDGRVLYYSGSTGWLGLNSITFQADQ